MDQKIKIRNEIRDKLREYNLSQVWLIRQLQRANFVTDKSEMSSILSGSRNGAKVETMLSLSRSIISEYEKFEVSVSKELNC